MPHQLMKGKLMSKQASPKMEPLAESLGFLIGHTNLLKDRLLDKHLEPEDITAGQAKALFNIYRFNKTRPCDIGKSLGVDNSAITRMLDRLEKKGLIQRTPAPEDRRALIIGLTDKGYETIERALPLAGNAIAELAHALTDEEQSQLKHCLRKILVASGCAFAQEHYSVPDSSADQQE
jgi:Transcriptional regulators